MQLVCAEGLPLVRTVNCTINWKIRSAALLIALRLPSIGAFADVWPPVLGELDNPRNQICGVVAGQIFCSTPQSDHRKIIVTGSQNPVTHIMVESNLDNRTARYLFCQGPRHPAYSQPTECSLIGATRENPEAWISFARFPLLLRGFKDQIRELLRAHVAQERSVWGIFYSESKDENVTGFNSAISRTSQFGLIAPAFLMDVPETFAYQEPTPTFSRNALIIQVARVLRNIIRAQDGSPPSRGDVLAFSSN